MSKSRSRSVMDDDTSDNTLWVRLDDIVISDSTYAKLMRRDFGQIEKMRARFENGQEMVRVVLHARIDGGYTIEDGRHRIIAARLAGVGFIEALVVG